MKKLVLSLLGAATLAMSSNALALDTTTAYQAILTRGPTAATAIPVGALQFVFWGDMPSNFNGVINPGACQYMAEWDDFYSTAGGIINPSGLSGQILVDEAKAVGQFSCPANSLFPTFSFLTLDNMTVPAAFNMGFNTFQQLTQVLSLELGESGWDLEGVIQYWGPVNVVYGFQLTKI